MGLWIILESKLRTHCTHLIWSEHSYFSGFLSLPEFCYQHREMLSTFLILPTNLFLAQWRFQPVEHRTLFKLQNNLTYGYLQTLQWANTNRARDATDPLENWGKFICTNGRRRKNKRTFTKWKQTWSANVGRGSRRRRHRSTIQAIFQAADWHSFPEVLMFACVAPDFSCGDYLFA